MTINFVPNDPRASQFSKPTVIKPRRNRTIGAADFDFGALPKQGLYAPGSIDALAWQSREAALAAVEMFEGLHGSVKAWARSPNRKRLAFLPDAGEEVNAYYDGESVSFFHYPVGKKITYVGASTQVVAHEVGHALLDVIRPDLWDANFLEAAAFHEAFGDCIAILTVLADPAIRKAVAKKLDKKNFVETFGEELALTALKIYGTKENSSKPRQALNTYQWELPSTLPNNAPGGMLINEPHSFGQVFSGCFYDLIRMIFAQTRTHTADSLWAAASTAAKLLFEAAKAAPITPRFFQAIGRAMTLRNESDGGELREVIRGAFDNHGIALGSAALKAPKTQLAGINMSVAKDTVVLAAATRQDIRRRIGAEGHSLRTRAVQLGAQHIAEVSYARQVDLSGIASYLKGVSAAGLEPVLVGPVRGATRGAVAVMGSLPDATSTNEEVRTFVGGLVAHSAIIAAQRKVQMRLKAPVRTRAAASLSPEKPPSMQTHEVVMRGGAKVLRRRGFVCGCGLSHS